MIRNRILYSAIIVISLLFIFFYDGRVVFITLYSVLLLPVVSFLMALLSVYGLSVSQSVDKDFIVKDEEAIYTLYIKNKSILAYPCIRFNFEEDKFDVASESKSVVISLNPRARENISFSIFCRYRGLYEIGLREIIINDFLGLFSIRRRVQDKIVVTVYPKVVEIPNFPLSMNLLSKAQSNYAIKDEDYSTISDVRKYSPEDSYKRIHWKLSAKKSELIVKNFQSTARNATAVILDNMRHTFGVFENIVLEDKIIEGLVAVLHYCLKRQFPVELLYGYGQRHEAANISDFEKLYAVSAELPFDGQRPVLHLIEEYLNDQVNFTNIIILTSVLDAGLFNRIAGAFYFGHHISLVYFSDGSASGSDELIMELRQAGISCYMIGADDSITELLGA